MSDRDEPVWQEADRKKGRENLLVLAGAAVLGIALYASTVWLLSGQAFHAVGDAILTWRSSLY